MELRISEIEYFIKQICAIRLFRQQFTCESTILRTVYLEIKSTASNEHEENDWLVHCRYKPTNSDERGIEERENEEGKCWLINNSKNNIHRK